MSNWPIWFGIGTGLLLCSVSCSSPSDGTVQENIEWPQVSLILEATGLNQPVHITHAGDGSDRLFLVEQDGRIWILTNGVLLNEPFLDISGRVSCCGERGLLSVAFPPDYANQGYFYVNYTDSLGNTVVSRLHVTANSDVADPNSEEIVLTVNQPHSNHNGGQLAFGPDGYLYIGMGDGGSAGDPDDHGQNPNSLLGKILRIDVESGVIPYDIPPSNPFIPSPSFLDEIWALGLRNPWRFSFDRETGDLYIGDVGQDSFEEIDVQLASSMGGENYGWRIMEGAHCFDPNPCDQTGLVLPVIEYDQSQGCSITGGHVYRGQNYPRMQGIYFYADYCTGVIWGLIHDGVAWQNSLLFDSPYFISSFGENEAGDLYVADHDNGDIYQIIHISNGELSISKPLGLLLDFAPILLLKNR